MPRLTAPTDDDRLHHDGESLDTVIQMTSGVEATKQRVEAFDDADRRRQRWIIRRSFRCSYELSVPPNADPASDDRFYQTARTAFEEIRDGALVVDGRREWISTDPDDRPMSIIPARESLYLGRSGIAVTAGALHRVTGDDDYRQTAVETMEPVLDRVTADSPLAAGHTRTIGGALGVGSVVYACTVLGEWFDNDRLRETATTALDRLDDERIEAADDTEMLDGLAGTALAALACYDRTGATVALDRAIACGDRLLELREPIGDAGHRTWRTVQDRPHTGFAHGSTGIAYALARVGVAADADRFVDAAYEALAFEDELYDPTRQNWALAPGINGYDNRWCHGRPGIALGRLAIATTVGDDELLAEAESALAATAETTPSEMDLLCCGNFGRAEVLQIAADHGIDHHEDAVQLASRCLARRETEGTFALQGHGSSFVNPTWFNGLAGVAYTCLRLVEPDTLPSVLLLE